jgi:hypothetical protein
LTSDKPKSLNLDNIKINLALAYKVLHKLDASETILRSLLNLPVADSIDMAFTLRASHTLAEILLHRGKLDEADQFFRRALLGRRQLYGKDRPLYRKTMIVAIEICKARGESELAEACEAALPSEKAVA